MDSEISLKTLQLVLKANTEWPGFVLNVDSFSQWQRGREEGKEQFHKSDQALGLVLMASGEILGSVLPRNERNGPRGHPGGRTCPGTRRAARLPF